MTVTINASTSTGLVQTADTSGILNIQSNGVNTNAQAWVNFNGVSTATIRASYNISSVTYNGTGDYTLNFTNAMTDTNYATIMSGTMDVVSSGAQYWIGMRASSGTPTTKTTSAVRVVSLQYNTAQIDSQQMSIVIFR